MKTLYSSIATAVLVISCCLLFIISNAQPGTLDITFGTGGIVTTPIGTANDLAYSAVLQPDGKIVVAGYSYNGTDNDFAVVRYKTLGALDNTFGTGGKATAAIGTANDIGYSVALESNGKIVMAGQAQNGTYPAFGVARFTTAGVLDITFGNGGRVITPVGTTGIANSIAIQSDGKIVVAGESQDAVSYDFAVARYDTSGNLDNTFGTGGIVVTPIGTSTDIGYAMAIQSDGKIVVAGTSLIGTGSDFALVRYNTNGTLDNTFGTGGKVTTDFGSPNDICNSVAIQSNGKIVAGGQYYNGTNNDFAIARYNTNGALDATFGTGGKVTTPIGTRADVGYGVAIQSDGKIIMTGNSDNGTYINVAVVRYNSTGTLDNGFGTAGEVTTLIASGNSTGRSVLVQGDGKVVVAGYFLTGGYNDFAVARYNGGTVGIDEEAPENSFCIMPNPANNMFTLQLNSELKNAEVRIYDELGTEVFSESSVNAQQTQIDCNRFASGIYFVQVMDGEKLITKKLVIEKL